MTTGETREASQFLNGLNQRIGVTEQSVEPAANDGTALAVARTFFESVLSDQLIFRRASGRVDDKSAFLKGLENNPFEARESEQIAVEVKGDRALVTLVVVGTMRADKTVHRYRNIRLFSRDGGGWRLELWYNYEIPDA